VVVVNRVEGDQVVTGEILGPTNIQYPAGKIDNAAVSSTAAIAASKCQKSLRYTYFQPGTMADATIVCFFALNTITFKHVRVTNLTACTGDATCTVDVKANGTTILSSVVTLDSSTAAYSERSGTITDTSAADGEYITVVIDATVGTGALGTGVMVQIDFDEVYAS
jgi:hypothetical protein